MSAPPSFVKSAYILRDNGDPIRFDVVTQETHTLTNDITEHPVESGANVTDHVRSQLDTIALEVFVSNAPISPESRFTFGLDDGSVGSLDLQPSGGTDKRLNGRAATVLQFDQAINFVAETYNQVRIMKENAELVTVVTRLWDYDDMVVKDVSIPRTSAEGDGAKFTVTFKQVRLVETKLVAAPVPTEVRGKPAVNKGATGNEGFGTRDEEDTKKSLLATAADKLTGLLQ